MPFSIKFLNDPIPEDWLLKDEKGYLVEVNINDFSEKDTVLIDLFNVQDYLRLWSDAVDILTGQTSEAKAAFPTSVHDPNDGIHNYGIQWWTAYRRGDDVIIRNSAVHQFDIGDLKTPRSIFKYVPEFEPNHELSEWKVSVDDIKMFGNYLKSINNRMKI